MYDWKIMYVWNLCMNSNIYIYDTNAEKPHTRVVTVPPPFSPLMPGVPGAPFSPCGPGAPAGPALPSR